MQKVWMRMGLIAVPNSLPLILHMFAVGKCLCLTFSFFVEKEKNKTN